MKTPDSHSWLEVRQEGTAAVVKLPAGDLFHQETIDLLGEHLTHLVETSGCRYLVLNFESVDRMASNMLGVLVVIAKKVANRKGRLTLCSLNPDLREVFATLKLDKVFTIRDGEQEAMADLR